MSIFEISQKPSTHSLSLSSKHGITWKTGENIGKNEIAPALLSTPMTANCMSLWHNPCSSKFPPH